MPQPCRRCGWPNKNPYCDECQPMRWKLADDLEEAARLLRNGTHEDLAEFANRDIKARAKAAAKRAS